MTTVASSASASSSAAFDYMLKLLLIGDSAVGKTALLFRFADDCFTSSFVSTVGIDFKVKTLVRASDGKRVKLQVWDTAGQERYRTITKAYYRGAMGFLLVYDVTNERSFLAVRDWLDQIQRCSSWHSARVVLVGNKVDLVTVRNKGDKQQQPLQIREVDVDRARQLAEELDLDFFETSAKENINVTEAFEALVDLIFETIEEQQKQQANQQQESGASSGVDISSFMFANGPNSKQMISRYWEGDENESDDTTDNPQNKQKKNQNQSQSSGCSCG